MIVWYVFAVEISSFAEEIFDDPSKLTIGREENIPIETKRMIMMTPRSETINLE